MGESLEAKFDRNPLATNLPLPRQYFSFDCTKWCIESAFEFVQVFYDRMGVKPPHQISKREGNLWNPDSLISVEEIENPGE